MLPLSEWQTLFSVQAESAATLTGLVFVAVSINLSRILSSPGLAGRAAESIAQFLQFLAAICLLTGSSAGLYWLVPGFLLSFFAGVVNAWILLIEINR